jgi:dienelactone hydrolase
MLPLNRFRVLVVLALAFAGCGESDLGQNEPPLETAVLAAPGTHAFAFFDLDLTDESRATPPNGTFAGLPYRHLPARVWYPTLAGSGSTDPASDGPFPLIGYGHGFFSGRLEAESVAPHLASHGYVVISVEFPLSNGGAPGGPTVGDMTNQPGDLAFAMAEVSKTDGSSVLGSVIDTTRRGIAGLSLGGGTVLIGAYHPKWHIDNIQAAVAYAPASCFFGPGLYTRSLPLLMLSGDRDLLVRLEDGPQRAFDNAQPPISLVTLHGGNHVGFIGLEKLDGGNADDVGCLVVGSGGSTAASGAARLGESLMEGAAADVVGDPQQCAATCTTVVPQTMPSRRQQELTRAATLAHFEANLRGRRAAQRWLEETLGAQNADVTVEIRR